MPNTLFHIGVQIPATRVLARQPDVKWILLGCMLPDLPWILSRIIRSLPLPVSPYELRSAAIVLSSLFACLVFAAAAAQFSKLRLRAFGVLAFGSLLHLLVDASQTKWGNGVDILAPIVWRQWSFELYWPESPVTFALTGWGLILAIAMWRQWPPTGRDFQWPGPGRLAVSAALFAAWFALVPTFGAQPWINNYHSMQVLANAENAASREVAVDRGKLLRHEGGKAIRAFDDVVRPVTSLSVDPPAVVSLRGTMTIDGQIVVRDFHRHAGKLRDVPSYMGLVMVLVYWVLSIYDAWRCR